MIRWLIYLPISLIMTIVCYLTNFIVLLFCDKDGELHGFWHLWQTWDNSCNPSDIKDIVPKWLLIDWDKHYKEREGTTDYLNKVNRKRWFTDCINDNWTFIERIKRYLCRLIWLTRNNCYGWAFYVLGYTASTKIEVHEEDNLIEMKDTNGYGWMRKNTKKIFSLFGYELHWNNLLGWKLSADEKFDTRSMIANRVAFYITKEK